MVQGGSRVQDLTKELLELHLALQLKLLCGYKLLFCTSFKPLVIILNLISTLNILLQSFPEGPLFTS